VSDTPKKDKVPTSARVEFALAMHNFHELLKAHQVTVDQIKKANRGRKEEDNRNSQEQEWHPSID